LGYQRVEHSESSSSEVDNLNFLIAAKDQELFESMQKHTKLEVANTQLQELLDAATQKNRELVEHAKEVDANVHHANAEHFKVLEDLH
jgi:predicted methyltransferase